MIGPLTEQEVKSRLYNLGVVLRAVVTVQMNQNQISSVTGRTLLSLLQWSDPNDNDEEPETSKDFDPKKFIENFKEKFKE